jgi:hypothetical protein
MNITLCKQRDELTKVCLPGDHKQALKGKREVKNSLPGLTSFTGYV